MEKVIYENILCIDPGSDTLGVSLVTYEEHKPITITYCQTHKASRIIVNEKFEEMRIRYGELLTRLHAQKQNLKRLIKILQPSILAIESPFFNPRNPQSAAVLMYVKQMLNELAHDEEVGLDIVWISPQQMKRLIGAKLVKNENKVAKDLVKEAVRDLIKEEEIILDGIDFDTLDEHSVDSIGIGYAYVKLLKEKE